MLTKFEELCTTLELRPDVATDQGLERMKIWCFEHVSLERHPGDYSKYLTLLRDYLNVFLTNIETVGYNIKEALPIFNNMNAIQFAACKGYDRFLAKLDASSHASLNLKTQNGMTPLHLAAAHGHFYSVRALLSQGADPGQMNHKNEFPIYSALFTSIMADANLKNKKAMIFNLLRSAAPDTVLLKNIEGETVAHAMACHGYEILLNDLMIHPENRNILFMCDNFMKYAIHVAILNNQIEIVNLLLWDPAVSNQANADGQVALHYAAQNGSLEILSACCEKQANIDVLDHLGKTPLLCAVEAANLSAAIFLFSHGADVNLRDSRGLSTLHYAVMSDSEEMVQWILKNINLDINIEDGEGNTAIFYAEQNNNQEIVDLLLAKGAFRNVPINAN